jgi:hypothetical protein
MAIGLFLFLEGWRFYAPREVASFMITAPAQTPIVSGVPIPYTTAREYHMTLLNKVFTTGTLVKIILVLITVVAMKAASLHYDFSWATALAAE